MKRILSLLLCIALLAGTTCAEEFFAVEEEFVLAEEEPVFAEETVEAVEEAFAPEAEEETVFTEELLPVEELEPLVEEVAVEEAQETSALLSGTWGTCDWEIDGYYTLTIHEGTGADTDGVSPWQNHCQLIRSVQAYEPIVLPQDSSSLLANLVNCESMDITGFETGNVVDMGGMFYYCGSLTSLRVTSFDTRNVTNMSQMFEGCSRLKYLNLSVFNTAKVTSMMFMFASCSDLISLDLSHFDTRNAENMYCMFADCLSLQELNLSGLSTAKARQYCPGEYDEINSGIYGMFQNCGALELVTIGSGFSFKNARGEVMTQLPRNVWYAKSDNLSYTAQEIAEGRNGIADTYKTMPFFSIASGYWGTCAWDIDADGVLTIHGGTGENIEGYPGCPWYEYQEQITAVVARERIVLPEDAHGLFRALYLCTQMDLSGFDTSNTVDISCMFEQCNALTELDLRTFDTRNVESIGMMFCACINLKQIRFPGINDAGDFSTDKATDMGYMFWCCQSLTQLDLRFFSTSNVESMEYMFYGCKQLKKLDIDFDTAKVENMGEMFSGCSCLEELDLSSFDTGSASRMGDMFMGCDSLAVVKLGTGFSFMGAMDEIITWLPYGPWNSRSDKATYNALEIAESRNHIADTYQLDNSLMACGWWGTCRWEIDNDGVLTIHAGTGEDTHWTCPWEDYAVGITAVVATERIVLPGDCSFLLALSWWDEENLSNCVSMNLSGFITSNVERMTWMFGDCISLRELDLSNFDTGNVIYMDTMFAGCVGLTKLNISSFDTGNVTDMGYMFSDCRGLKKLDLSGFDTSSVTEMGGMFYGCSGLTKLNLSGFDTSGAKYMSFMFHGCSGLTELDLSGFDTSSVTFMDYMFYGCDSLVALNISGFDMTLAVSSGTNDANNYGLTSMFDGCDALKYVSVGKRFVLADPDGYVLTTLPEKTWYAKSDRKAYTAQQIAESRNYIADVYSTVPFPSVKTVSGLTVQAVDTNASRLSWNKVSGAAGYQLYRSENGGDFKWIKNCATNSVNNYSLKPGADYRYKVRAYTALEFGDKVYGSFSGVVSVHILGQIQNLTVTGKDTNCAMLKWDRVDGCTGYQVFRTVAGSGEYQWVKNATTPQVANYSLAPGTTYYYRVRAYIDLPDGKRAYGQYSDGVKVYIQPQVVIQKLVGGSGRIALEWTRAEGCTGYQIFYTEAGTGGEYRWWKNIPAGTLTATLTGLKPNTDYWFKVRSYVDLPGGGRYYGQLSEAKHVWTNK